MAEDKITSALEERKLSLDERRLDSENEFRRLELELKTREGSWLNKLGSPLTTTVIAGILALAASAVGALLQGRQTLDLERQKFQFAKEQDLQKQEHELILKMISVGDVKQARTNLEFLAETGLVTKERAERILKAKADPVLPTPLGITAGSPIDRCKIEVGSQARTNFIQIERTSLLIESCVSKEEDGYGYIYRIQNTGSQAVDNLRWEAAGMAWRLLSPGRSVSVFRIKRDPPREAQTELIAGSGSKASFQTLLPSTLSLKFP